jgi:hypothetical protein
MKLLLAILLLVASSTAQTWGNIPAAGNISTIGAGPAIVYHYSKALTIQGSLVPSTQANFPVLVFDTDTALKTVGNGGHVQNASGYDIVYGLDQFCTSTLSYERETYTASSGAVLDWVNVPSVAGTSNTAIYRCYGNVTISSSQQNVAGTWSNGYVSVFHGGIGSLNLNDSLGTNSLTNNGLSAYSSGVIGGGVATVGTGTWAKKASPTGLPVGTAQRTLEFWAYLTSAPVSANNFEPFSYGNLSACGNDGFEVMAGYPGLIVGAPAEWYFMDEVCNQFFSFHSVDIGGWHYLAAAFPSGGTVNGSTQTYYDGALQTTNTYVKASLTHAFSTPTPANLQINNPAGTAVPAGSYVDELRISNVARSAAWITAQYNNMTSPSTFYSVGTETNQ